MISQQRIILSATVSYGFALTLFSAVLISHIRPASGCFAAGVCGGGCAPPPPPTCYGGCGGGYSCGQYGCYRQRARVASSKTLKIPLSGDGAASEVEELQAAVLASRRRRLETPDERFMACCEERNLPDACLNKCTFATYTRAALQNMYFRMDGCPMQAAADMQFCAAQGRDHRQCCARNGVANTLAGEKCLVFCNQVPGNVTQLDLSYMSCYDRFENIKGCFWHDVQRRIQLAARHHRLRKSA